MKRAGFALSLALMVTAIPAWQVRADSLFDAAFATAPNDVVVSSDEALAGMRGKYVPSEERSLEIWERSNLSAPALPSTNATAVTAGPTTGTTIATTGSAGQIVYFGLDLLSSWSSPASGGGEAVYTASADLGIDLSGKTPVVTISSADGHSGGEPVLQAPVGSTVAGAIGDGRVSGITQQIQAAGNGNSIANTASVDVSSTTGETSIVPRFVLAPANAGPCGSACSVTLDPKAFGVVITLPGGTISQGIGSHGVYQYAAVASSSNTISNQLGIHLQTGNSVEEPIVMRTMMLPTSALMHY